MRRATFGPGAACPSRRGLRLLLAGLLLLLFALAAGAQTTEPASNAPAASQGETAATPEAAKSSFQPSLTAEQAKERATAVQAEIDQYTARADSVASGDLTADGLQRLLTTLGALHSSYVRYPSALEGLQKAKDETAEYESQKDQPVLGDANPPYNLSFYEKIRNEYEGLNQQLQSVLASIRLVGGTGTIVQGGIPDAEKRLSQLKADTGQLSDEAMALRSLEIRDAEAALENAKITHELYQLAEQANGLRKGVLEKRTAAYVEALKTVKKNLRFDKEDLEQHLRAANERAAAVQKELAAARVEYEKRRTSLARSQNTPASAKSEHERVINQATIADKEALVRLSEIVIESGEQSLLFLEETKRIWELRYELINGSIDGEKMWNTRSATTSRMESLESSFQIQQRNLASIQTEVVAGRKDLDAAEKDAGLRTLIRNRITTLNKQSETINGAIAETLNLFNQYGRLHEELSGKLDAVRIAEKVSSVGKEKFFAFWNTTLWSGDDFDVTIAKLTLAIFLFIGAFFLSGRVTNFLAKRLFVRFGMDSQAAAAVQKVLFYVLMFAFLLSALDLVGIPLTAFAFLGGALAIGIGFGAQNIFSNLISGFIITFTKPIRAGDIVEADGVTAVVEEVGSRSTRLRTFDNMDSRTSS